MFKEKTAVIRVKILARKLLLLFCRILVLYIIKPPQHQRVSVLDTRWYRPTSVEVRILNMYVIWEQNGLLTINK